MVPPAERFGQHPTATVTPLADAAQRPAVARRRRSGSLVGQARSGSSRVDWQQVSVGIAAAGRNIDVWVTDDVLQFFDGDHLLRTEQRINHGPVRKKRASIPTRSRRPNLTNQCQRSTEHRSVNPQPKPAGPPCDVARHRAGRDDGSPSEERACARRLARRVLIVIVQVESREPTALVRAGGGERDRRAGTTGSAQLRRRGLVEGALLATAVRRRCGDHVEGWLPREGCTMS